jgi:redox-sensitive bicupin YhaK (pirin superfamily)
LYSTILHSGENASHSLAPGRVGYVQVARGHAGVNDQDLSTGDGLTLTDEPAFRLSAMDESEILVFDLPGV